MYFCFFAASELRLVGETAVFLTTLQVCVILSSFKDRLLWLHIAISESAFVSLGQCVRPSTATNPTLHREKR